MPCIHSSVLPVVIEWTSIISNIMVVTVLLHTIYIVLMCFYLFSCTIVGVIPDFIVVMTRNYDVDVLRKEKKVTFYSLL